MGTHSKKLDFLTSEQGLMATKVLDAMVLDSAYITKPSFSANTDRYADNLIPFTEKHLFYLRDHPKTDPQQYLSNLKLITRVKR